MSGELKSTKEKDAAIAMAQAKADRSGRRMFVYWGRGWKMDRYAPMNRAYTEVHPRALSSSQKVEVPHACG